jgi:hypothetical protein
MNPDMIDGISRPDSTWSRNNVKRALRAEAIISKLDPERIVYHHSSGNLSPMHTSNFYPNWVPIQEMNDWFEHWATAGVKPLMLCEFGAPFTWDWAMYRGWYKGKREFGSAQVPWEFCLAEWNAQFLGDRAYKITEFEKMNLRWEADRFRAGAVWGRSGYPHNFDSRTLEERNPVFAMHLSDNWRAFRTWGMSINSPWHHSPYWKLREGAPASSGREIPNDWENLQRPGLIPDFTGERANRRDLDVGFNESDWIPNLAGEALIQNNKPLLGYIAGKPDAFTSKDHNFTGGTIIEKQLIIINNSRATVRCECNWAINLPGNINGSKVVSIETGNQGRIPVRIDLPASLKPGKYELTASFRFDTGEIQGDAFTIHVLALPTVPVNPEVKTALFDPDGETRKMMDSAGIPYQTVNADADLSGFEVLVIGREALKPDSVKIDMSSVRDGLKVIVFEQTAGVLEQRFGFRVQEYGLRQVYKRVSDHPALSGLENDNLSYWKGSATILPARLKYESNTEVFSGVPTVKWCDITVTRLWRCGNRGNVASVLIEKPASGNFLPLVDGGFSLQYSPLMEYREGKGMVMFCQMDVTGRTESDPAAEQLTRNIFSYVAGWKAREVRQSLYAGDNAGLEHLRKTGLNVTMFSGKKPAAGQVLIAGPGSSKLLSPAAKTIAKWIKSGGHILAVGLDEAELNSFLPVRISTRREEYIAAHFEAQPVTSLFAGIGPADTFNRAPKEIPLVSGGADITGSGILARTEKDSIALCQFVPWQCDFSREQHNGKQTFRRSSFALSRILGNMNAAFITPVLDRFNTPLNPAKQEKRWLDGLYVDIPEEWDDPYRFFRW